jgi:hypothetical protein
VIRHIVLFKLKPGFTEDSPEVRAAVALARRAGAELAAVREWYFGRNVSTRPTAYDYVIIALVADEPAMASYLADPFHQDMSRHWQVITEWVIADVHEQADDHAGGGRPLLSLGRPM